MAQTRGFQTRERVSDRTLDPRLFVSGPSGLASALRGGLKGGQKAVEGQRTADLQERTMDIQEGQETRAQEIFGLKTEELKRQAEQRKLQEEMFQNEAIPRLQAMQQLSEEEKAELPPIQRSRLTAFEKAEAIATDGQPKLAAFREFLEEDLKDLEQADPLEQRKDEAETKIAEAKLEKLQRELDKPEDKRKKYESPEKGMEDLGEGATFEPTEDGMWVPTRSTPREGGGESVLFPQFGPLTSGTEARLNQAAIALGRGPQEGETASEFYQAAIESGNMQNIDFMDALMMGRLGLGRGGTNTPAPTDTPPTEGQGEPTYGLREDGTFGLLNE